VRGEQWQARPRGNPYLEIFRLPGALAFSAAGALARMPMAMFGLGTVLLISAITGRYGLAGTVAAAGSIGYAVCAPQAAKLADRFGQHRVLRPLALIFALSTIIFIGCAELRAPVWALVLSGVAAGASMPSLGSMVRARWSALLGDSPRLHTAFAFESVNDEMIFVVGPVIVTVLATEVYPAAGLALATLLCVTGTLLFAAQRRTEPRPLARRPGPAPSAAAETPPSPLSAPVAAAPPLSSPPPAAPTPSPPVAAAAPRAAPRAASPLAALAAWRGRFRVPAPGLIVLVPVYWCLGVTFASVDLSTIAFAQEHGHKPLAGFLLGCYALGSAVGGLMYGSRSWRTPVERRFLISLCCTAAGIATFWAQPGLLSLALVIFVSGLTISPTFIAGYSLVEGQAPVQRRTEGMAWLSSSISVGVATGSAIVGHIIDASGARWGYAFAAVGALAAVLTCLLGTRRLRPPRPADASA
jgi:MFS family permease